MKQLWNAYDIVNLKENGKKQLLTNANVNAQFSYLSKGAMTTSEEFTRIEIIYKHFS